ncbi:hypothetical protein FB451DRAFT_139010 [Mycena latifolia]|nr:hypothetical protein FB451DRAFT_139010 [Mycena latifolia]
MLRCSLPRPINRENKMGKLLPAAFILFPAPTKPPSVTRSKSRPVKAQPSSTRPMPVKLLLAHHRRRSPVYETPGSSDPAPPVPCQGQGSGRLAHRRFNYEQVRIAGGWAGVPRMPGLYFGLAPPGQGSDKAEYRHFALPRTMDASRANSARTAQRSRCRPVHVPSCAMRAPRIVLACVPLPNPGAFAIKTAPGPECQPGREGASSPELCAGARAGEV